MATTNFILECWDAVRARDDGKVLVHAADGSPVWTARALDREAAGWARRFRDGRGAVGIAVGHDPLFFPVLLGAWQASRCVALLDAGAARESVAQCIQTANVSVVVGSGGVLEPTQLEGTDSGCDRLSAIKFTSGSTGQPQAVGFTAEQLAADAQQVCSTMGVGRDDRNFALIPLSHSYGFSNLVTPLLCFGVPLVLSADAMPHAVGRAVEMSGATVMPLVPAFCRSLLTLQTLPSTVRLVISAGAPLDTAIAREFQHRFGRKIHSFYGASECGGICYDATDDLIATPGFVGHPLQGVSLEQVPPETADGSKVRVHSAALGGGADFFEPSDLLVRHPEGWSIVGRASDVLNVGGKKVHAAEIARILSRLSGIRDVHVVGIPDGQRGDRIVAVVESDASENELRRWAAGVLPSWQLPREWVTVTAIPRTGRGKIDHLAIGRLVGSTPEAAE